ncbi:hypothetical protein BGZ95_004806, partial [Linnemannia exigua]
MKALQDATPSEAFIMSDHPLEQLDPQVRGSDSPNSTVRIRTRDKFREILGFPKSKSKDLKSIESNQPLHSRPPSQKSTRPSSIISQVSNDPPCDNLSVVIPPVIEEVNPLSFPQPMPPNMAQVVTDIFPDNLPKPVIKAQPLRLQERIESTEQSVYCSSLLLQNSLMPTAVPGDYVASDAALCLQESALDKAEVDWLEEIKKDPMEQDHLRWLLTRMVEVFIEDTTKDSVKIAEIVTLGPVLQKEPYRKLLSSLIKDFDDAHILDVNILQGLVELVQSASSDHLVSDDLVRVLSILRVHLQRTHQQSTAHSYHLTLAVSKVLDVMADHKVQGLDSVLRHEPLSGVLSGINGGSDPYVIYQACYAFQALQYVPDDESVLQTVLRHSIGVTNGLVKVSTLFKLDLASVLDGLDRLQEPLRGIVEVASTVYEGQLKDLRQLIFEAPCRHDPFFQWGICQLLGEIAVSPVWAAVTRQQAITLLGQLFKVDRDWGHDESVKAWMLTIITKLNSTSDKTVNTIAFGLLQGIDQDKGALFQHPYPLMTHRPIPASSPILAKVQNIPSV